ncbi:hypothetical protein [Sphingobacterium bovistauri]|uniref:Uncharacterized protein n=1 Tax=Sphingobacterium bovistauri TaxID=2781959 RepID=A0ABS7ZAZ6_9SPHI|nr:hypothetical protein [Sphingobacterium bovistauri]MCA5006767.1 hypothetical protein [Sphingobacterium bovistauri]
MIKFFGSLILVFNLFIVNAQSLNLHDVRKDFNRGVKDEVLCKKYLSLLQKNAKSPLEKGYQAAFNMFMAKHTSNPFKKMGYFKDGKKLLESQIKLESNNIELRFIRLSIQYHIPDYLGYKENINEDKEYLVSNLYKLKDDKAKDIIYNYLKGANMYNSEELSLLGR